MHAVYLMYSPFQYIVCLTYCDWYLFTPAPSLFLRLVVNILTTGVFSVLAPVSVLDTDLRRPCPAIYALRCIGRLS